MMKIFVLILVLLSLQSFAALGQTIDPESNWRKEVLGIDDYMSRFDLSRYTLNEIALAKARYSSLKSIEPIDEWEGTYRKGTMLGTDELTWSLANGFVNTYIYHTLAVLDFGHSLSTNDTVTLFSERAPHPKYRKPLKETFVKVRFGNSHYLVPQKRLSDFAERAAGLSPNLEDWAYYWEKKNKSEVVFSGLPVFPRKYAHLIRTPIKTRILKVGRKLTHVNKFDDGSVNYKEIFVSVTLSHGHNHGLKKGMNLFVGDLGEWVEVTKVFPKYSLGRLRRDFGENEGDEECFNQERGQGDIIPCKIVKIGMKAQTKLSDVFF